MSVLPFDLYVCPLTPCSKSMSEGKWGKNKDHISWKTGMVKMITKADLFVHEQKGSTKFVNALVTFFQVTYFSCYNKTTVLLKFQS